MATGTASASRWPFLGMTLQLTGDTGGAAQCVREALELSRSNGSITSSLYSLGSMYFGAITAGDMASLSD